VKLRVHIRRKLNKSLLFLDKELYKIKIKIFRKTSDHGIRKLQNNSEDFVQSIRITQLKTIV